ncbi:type II and III secretion system protein [Thermomonas hydrothermalis]|uniref:Type II and III secretion system protein n=1 Tax=Thermomonas hydrothermalis TaxID=213588 RepID=A0A1M4WGT0_9GAMM|nr:type II and III secretion system protein [Thermomonas hydrothermalis]
MSALHNKACDFSRGLFTSLGSFGQVPQIARREVNTAVLVDDGQTVVIGGVYEFSDTTDISKVPFLGDVPILGNLFKNKNRTKSKAELLVFITPKVMRVAQR